MKIETDEIRIRAMEKTVGLIERAALIAGFGAIGYGFYWFLNRLFTPHARFEMQQMQAQEKIGPPEPGSGGSGAQGAGITGGVGQSPGYHPELTVGKTPPSAQQAVGEYCMTIIGKYETNPSHTATYCYKTQPDRTNAETFFKARGFNVLSEFTKPA